VSPTTQLLTVSPASAARKDAEENFDFRRNGARLARCLFGYAQLERVSEQEHKSFVPPAYVVGVEVQGVRTGAVAELANVG
jgi:hypothetical protein